MRLCVVCDISKGLSRLVETAPGVGLLCKRFGALYVGVESCYIYDIYRSIAGGVGVLEVGGFKGCGVPDVGVETGYVGNVYGVVAVDVAG